MADTHFSGLKLFDVKFTVGTEVVDAIPITVQLKDNYGFDLKARKSLLFYLAEDANGDIPETTAPTGGIAASVGKLIESVNNLSGLLITDANGKAVIDITDIGTLTFYLVVVLPDGRRAVSGPITFT